MKKVAFYTLGCKVNQYESEAMMDLFREAGYQLVDFQKKADVYLINSCTVTNEAARKSRQMSRRAKRRNQAAIVGLIGCYSQAAAEEVAAIAEIDFMMGSSGKKDIVDKVESLMAGKAASAKIVDFNKLREYEDLNLQSLVETTRANIKIEDGCDEFCSYCIIPFARGPVRSREAESVVKEVTELSQQGVKEIILTGTHLGAYGKDNNSPHALARLLKKLIRIDGLLRIRLSSLEGTELSEELIGLMANEEKVCPHLHLPLQSGSNKILKAMQRPYSREEFAEVVNSVREVVPNLALTTDVIVGFPGETEQTFQETYQFIDKLAFSRLHVFPFSARTGTPAARMNNQLNGNVIKEYSKKLRGLNQKLMLKYQQKFLGSIRSVIVEESRDRQTGLLTGFTDNYIKVLFSGEDNLKNQLINLNLVESIDAEHIRGELLT